MREIIYVALLLVGCGAPPSERAEVEQEPARPPATLRTTQAPSLPASAPESAPAPQVTFAIPEEVVAPKRYKLGGSPLLDCASHSVWSAPEGWTVTEVKGGVLSYSADKSALLLRGSAKGEEEAKALAEALIGGPISFEAPVIEKKHKWSQKRTSKGTASGALVAMIEVNPSPTQKSPLWVYAATGADQEESFALAQQATESQQSLVDHACVCGYDCDNRAP